MASRRVRAAAPLRLAALDCAAPRPSPAGGNWLSASLSKKRVFLVLTMGSTSLATECSVSAPLPLTGGVQSPDDQPSPNCQGCLLGLRIDGPVDRLLHRR